MKNKYNIVSNGQINISQGLWTELNSKHDKEFIKKMISDAIEENNLELPYREITLEQAQEDFKRLCELDTSTLLVNKKFESRYHYKYEFLDEYVELCNIGNKASDYFQQRNRFMCDSINAPSPYRTWKSERFRMTLLNALWTLKFREVNNDRLRSAIALRKYISSQFKPSVAKYVYDRFGGSKVLDFSSGWGDRLAGFYGSKNTQSYIGIDPNAKVVEKYEEQIKLYEQQGVHKMTRIIQSPAEDVNLNSKSTGDYDMFDLIFTSPPYFDIERYTQEGNQSWKRFKKLDGWLNEFLFKSIGYFWNRLQTSGHLIINISDVYCHHQIQKICDPMNDYISSLNGAKYAGAIGMRMAKRPNSKALKEGIFAEPMWIWKKK